VILGLGARRFFPDGGVMEISVSAWEGQPDEAPEAAIERARREALDALCLAKAEGTHALITW
jgi:hypothetical protein